MKWLLGVLVSCSVFVFGFNAYSASTDLSNLRHSTLLINVGEGNGSGVCIGPEQVLTAAHVAKPDFPITVQDLPATIVKRDEQFDLAELHVPGLNCKPIEIANVEPSLDTAIAIVGFPMNSMLQTQFLTFGNVQGYVFDAYRMMTSANILPGNSGGGVYAKGLFKWELVGILVEGFQDCQMFTCSKVSYIGRAVNLVSIKVFLKTKYGS